MAIFGLQSGHMKTKMSVKDLGTSVRDLKTSVRDLKTSGRDLKTSVRDGAAYSLLPFAR